MSSTVCPRVKTGAGLLEGFAENSVQKFLGVPYAAPPIGKFRWRPPAPVAVWAGVREAKRFASCCVQTVGASFNLRVQERSEDCLYLNVWTTSLDPDARRPVMVWIHGGGNLGGAGSEDAYDGTNFATKDVTFVTCNYRLGAFGFLAHPGVGANFAVHDQIAVLTWVQDNIRHFGGDPSNVTVFGQSGGAVAVRTLLSSPRARGLFHRAIMQSAGFERPAFAPSWSYERAQAAAEKLFERLGSRDLEALRQVPAEDVGRASHELCGIFPQPGRVHTPANLVWMPVPDGETVFEDACPGWPSDVPLMTGCVENEARYFIKPAGTYSEDVVAKMAAALCGPRHRDVMDLLTRQHDTPYEQLDRLFTTAIFTEPAHATVCEFARMGRRLYYYRFSRLSPGAISSQQLVKHTAEIPYVFGNLIDDVERYDEIDAQLSRQMQSAWIDFARGGEPRTPGGSPWPQFTLDNPRLTTIGNRIQSSPYTVGALIQALASIRTHHVSESLLGG